MNQKHKAISEKGEISMKYLGSLLVAILLLGCAGWGQTAASGGALSAVAYNYGGNGPNTPPPLRVGTSGGSTCTSCTATLTVTTGTITLNASGRTIAPLSVFAPVTVDTGVNAETVTPTAVSCTTPSIPNTCSFTASFIYAHGTGAVITSGTYGLQEALDDAYNSGGGIVRVDQLWAQAGGTTAIIVAALPFPSVYITDIRQGEQYWNVTPAATGVFSAPSALTSTTAFSSLTVAGSASYTGGTIHVCYALVDLEGNEGPCSADYSFTDTSAKAIQFTAPPAATGAVGWIPYIGLESGSAANEYQVLLWTQPTVLQVAPVSAGVCTLSAVLLQAGHYACAIANTTYGQSGSGAVVAAYPVVTSPQAVGTGGLSTASYYIGNTNSRTVYSYAPGTVPPPIGVVKASGAFHITTAAASTVPQVLGTIAVPAGFLNYVGREIRVCGYAYSSTQGASTIVSILLEWDAQGSDVTTGIPVIMGGPLALGTLTTGTTGQFTFCQNIKTTIPSASATGSTVRAGYGYLDECALTTCATPFTGLNMTVTAVGSLNLAGPGRIQVVMVQTTSSTAVPALIDATVEVLN